MEKGSKEIKDLSFEEFEKAFPNASKNETQKNRSLLKTLFVFPFKFFGSIFGIDKKSMAKSGRKSSYNMPSYPHPDSWKEQIRVDPPPLSHGRGYDPLNDVDRANVAAYLRGIDGKGDPRPPCDCDHDR